MKFLLLAGLGGFIGSVARAAVGVLLPTNGLATILVNLLGAFLIGFLVQYFTAFWHSSFLKPFFIVGICGGFTTFSAFTFELFGWLQSGKIFLGVIYLIVHLIGSLLLLICGMKIASLIEFPG